MKVAIVGDSFAHTYKDTWIEKVCNELDLEVIHHAGFRGQAQYRIYLEFLEVIKNNPDVIICCHTEHTRFYNKDGSREWLLDDEDFGKYIFSSILRDMQEVCKQRNIKLVNIPCFEHDFIDKTHGLWILSNGGLVNCSRVDYNREYNKNWTTFEDPRLNHFSANGHQILANNIISHIKTYITSEQEYHTVLLFPQLFA